MFGILAQSQDGTRVSQRPRWPAIQAAGLLLEPRDVVLKYLDFSSYWNLAVCTEPPAWPGRVLQPLVMRAPVRIIQAMAVTATKAWPPVLKGI